MSRCLSLREHRSRHQSSSSFFWAWIIMISHVGMHQQRWSLLSGEHHVLGYFDVRRWFGRVGPGTEFPEQLYYSYNYCCHEVSCKLLFAGKMLLLDVGPHRGVGQRGLKYPTCPPTCPLSNGRPSFSQPLSWCSGLICGGTFVHIHHSWVITGSNGKW